MIYVCIPAHNEERTIGVLLWKIRKVMREFGRDYEVLVFDDASTDETAKVLDRYRRVLPLRVLKEEHRAGYPSAVQRLLREALDRTSYPKRDAAVLLQADFSESPDYIVPLLKALEGGADIVAGVVEQNGLPAPRAVRVARRMAPWVLGRAYGGAPVSDPLSGFRAYRLIVLKKALAEFRGGPFLETDGWASNVELLGLVAPHARRIAEAPLTLRYDVAARPSRLSAVRTLRGLLRVRRERWEGHTREGKQ
ncbi:MAG: glycosyltransferase [Gemmatimonadota bacterium]|nr:glycosyltransferase [Gemmatimonadota bacterium]